MSIQRRQYFRRPGSLIAPLAAVTVLWLGACKSPDTRASDSAAAASSMSNDTLKSDSAKDTSGMAGMAGMNHSMEAAATDSNQAYLRMMVDHHQGLLMMTDSAMNRLTAASVKADANTLRGKQATEEQDMMAKLKATYNDNHAPMLMESNKAIMDSLLITKNGAAFDRDYYHHVVAHHQEGMGMIDRMLPHLTGDVKEMATKAKAEQQRDIQEFQRKARALKP